MIQKIKKFVVVAMAALAMTVPTLAPGVIGMASAASGITGNLCAGVNAAATGTANNSQCSTSGDGSNSIQTIASNVVNIFSLVVGAIAIIMIIWGGFKYITSGGDSGNVSSAKNTLIYAVVGLIIVALAQFIVHFVLTSADKAVPTQ